MKFQSEPFLEALASAALAKLKEFRPSQLVVIVLAKPQQKHLRAVCPAATQHILELVSAPILSQADIRVAARHVGARHATSRYLFTALVGQLESQVARHFEKFSDEHLDRLEEMTRSQYMIDAPTHDNDPRVMDAVPPVPNHDILALEDGPLISNEGQELDESHPPISHNDEDDPVIPDSDTDLDESVEFDDL
eukprot:gnl/MRDRNA2_/MRDRNA2_81281_c0_seq1.p1 gnl/MRDRNA2_/MRDRNA2_81281_c0~~gnl/MRDRNA2_/MRDRNA2_81281_c0_seq1.p1  ORF type:complete len:193 (+),score=46.68 gnl/MRDRNA2_/MRDRNA2_81281_c0_seq1:275-853(+)